MISKGESENNLSERSLNVRQKTAEHVPSQNK